jgi:hypothetical protein
METKLKLFLIAVAWALCFAGQPAVAGPVGPLTTFTSGTTAKASEVNDNFTAVKTAVNDNATRIATIEAALAPATGPFKLSSGPFGLPAGAASVDWTVLNNAATSQSITVSVYRANLAGAKTLLAPGALTLNLPAGQSTHNANSVGTSGQVFTPGFYYEVVLETSSPNVLPTVLVWQDSVGTVIPGTIIPAGSWVRLQ